MLPYEFPWWYVPLIYFILFMLYGGIGVLAGALFTYVLTTRHRAESSALSASQRLTFVLLGGLAGGAVQYTVVSLYAHYAW
jgi:hypothetical protein